MALSDYRTMSQLWQIAPGVALRLTLPDPAPDAQIPQVVVVGK